jgi:hypothetical protein
MRWILVLITTVLGAVLAGLGLYFTDQLGFYLVILMPILAGAIVGIGVNLPVLRAKVPTLPLLIFAIVGSLAAVAIYWFGQYNAYSEALISAVQEQDSSITREQAIDFIEEIQIDEYGSTGFQAFVSDYADVGFSITRSGSSGIEIQGDIAYAFWVVEALVVMFFAILTVVRRGKGALARRNQSATA